MSELKNPPLIEAIFEIKWGQGEQNKFEFHPQEEQILTGLIASSLNQKKFSYIENIPNAPKIPYQVTTRFRTKENEWPCYQAGLGVFTVNQITKGYTWESFRESMKNGLNVLNDELILSMIQHKKNTKLTLKYQDAFYPDDITTEEYITEYFNFSSNLPQNFYGKYTKDDKYDKVNIQYSLPLKDNNGYLTIICANAIINGRAGILIEFAVEVSLHAIMETFSVEKIMDWLEDAHDIQRHAFTTLIKEEAYVS